jgi:hypothetical protein
MRIVKALTAADIDFKREHHVSFDCLGGTYCRLDFVVIINGKVVVIEVDEEQHATYGVSCDVGRMVNLCSALLLDGNELPVLIVRYNPHAYDVDGIRRKTPRKDREAALINVVQRSTEADFTGLQIQYMYYNTNKAQVAIWDDPCYSADLKAFCRNPIV